MSSGRISGPIKFARIVPTLFRDMIFTTTMITIMRFFRIASPLHPHEKLRSRTRIEEARFKVLFVRSTLLKMRRIYERKKRQHKETHSTVGCQSGKINRTS